MEEKRKTWGQIALPLLEQQKYDTHSAQDQMVESLKEYEPTLIEFVEKHKAKYPGDFFVEVQMKRERIFRNTIRNYFFDRKTCSTPAWDQVVYRYHRATDRIEELWVIPSWQACIDLKRDALNIYGRERQLLNYILAFEDGTLLRISKKFNGESVSELYEKVLILH